MSTKTPGVYAITCLRNGAMYIGGSSDTPRRFQQHRYDLRRGWHKNSRLQADWDQFGEEAFSFGRIVKCPAEEVLVWEQRMIDRLKPEYNFNHFAHSSEGVRRSDEVRERLKRRPQSTAKLHEFQGQLLTVPQIAKLTGMSEPGVYVRLRTGQPLDAPNRLRHVETVELDGETLTLAQVAERAGLPLTTIHTRFRAGWAPADLLLPRKHRGRHST